VGATTPTWGTWDINASGMITLTFVVNVSAGVTPGTYDNTAYAVASNHPLIDDDGLQALDSNTLPTDTPETDEDVTVLGLPVLLIDKDTSTPNVVAGGQVTYTIVVSNTGGSAVSVSGGTKNGVVGCDVYETADKLIVKMDLAGVTREDIGISLDEDRLVIRGVRREQAHAEVISYHQMEVNYGYFERVFHLRHGIRQEDITAQFDDGFLTISIAKSPPDKKKTPVDIAIE
jgi:HSP20 family protein